MDGFTGGLILINATMDKTQHWIKSRYRMNLPQSVAVVILLYRFLEAGFFRAATSLAMEASKSSSSSLESSDASLSCGGYNLSLYYCVVLVSTLYSIQRTVHTLPKTSKASFTARLSLPREHITRTPAMPGVTLNLLWWLLVEFS